MKEKTIHFLISEQDKKKVIERASILGVNVSEYIRLSILNKNIDSRINRDTIAALNKIGSNINQIARALNSNPKALSLYRDLVPNLDDLIRQIHEINNKLKGK